MFSSALKALWSGMLQMIDTLCASLGAPADLPARGFIPRREGLIMRDMLRVAEHLLRRTLFLAALEAPPPAYAYRLPPLPRACAPRPAQTYFRFTTCTAGGRARRASKTQLPIAAEPLARRLQALLNIIEAPRAPIARLARRLKRQDGKKLARAITAPLPAFKTDPNHDYFAGIAPACDSAFRLRFADSC